MEGQMNRFDKRLIVVSATTAAAVALVTVVIYEGHMRATRGDQNMCVSESKHASVGSSTTCDVVSCALDNYQGECCAKLEARPEDGDRVKELEGCWRRVAKFDPAFAKDMSDAASAERQAYLDHDQLAEVIAGRFLEMSKQDRAILEPYCSNVVALDAEPDAQDCDPDQYRSKGTEFVNMGQYGAGLQQFKK